MTTELTISTAPKTGSVSLSHAEWIIIEHRLCLCDCLADVLEATYEWKWATCERIITDFCKRAARAVKAGEPITWENEIEAEALRDCVDGSTWFASADDAVASGQLTRGRLMGYIQSARRIEDKFEAAGLPTTGFPKC